MRENIGLFRGKRIDNGEWVEGYYYEGKFSGCYILVPEVKARKKDGVVIGDSFGVCQVIPETVGECTGLKDKNGKLIFEGDIVAQNWYDHDEPSDDSFGEVVFCEYDCSFSVMDIQKDGIVPLGRCHAYHWESEIIGNIHDNPELLKEGADNGND